MTGFTPEEWRTAARVARRSIFTEGNPDLADAWEKAADQAEARLVPAGGMALTAEQVEDVRALVWLDGRRNFDAFHRLRALFPATEPDEEVKPVKFPKMTAKYATANFGFPDVTDPFTRWAYKDSDGDKWAWNGDQWELHVVPPAPAEPAEDIRGLIEKSSLGTESAQALISTVSPEHGRRVAQEAARREAGTKVKLTELQRDLLQRIVDQWTKGAGWTHVFWSGTVEALISASCIVRHDEAFNEYRPTIFGEKALAPAEPAEEETKAEDGTLEALRDLFNGGPDTAIRTTWHFPVLRTVVPGCAEYWEVPAEDMRKILASSPVVPAPTETGPWQHRDGRICVYAPAVTPRLRYRIGKFNDHGDFVYDDSERLLPEGFAPFVAAEEGDS